MTAESKDFKSHLNITFSLTGLQVCSVPQCSNYDLKLEKAEPIRILTLMQTILVIFTFALPRSTGVVISENPLLVE